MPSSDSEDFESADEGHCRQEKIFEKQEKTLSSHSKVTKESDTNVKLHKADDEVQHDVISTSNTDEWDDFDILNKIDEKEKYGEKSTSKPALETKAVNAPSVTITQKDNTGWDDFQDWEQEDFQKPKEPTNDEKPHEKTKSSAEDVSAAAAKGWSWGWGGVDSFLNTATASISTITSQVSQGLSTVIETSIGAPDPAELARQTIRRDGDSANIQNEVEGKIEQCKDSVEDCNAATSEFPDAAFPFGSILSGVTKFVETTGTKVIAGGLDTLETIGKKTMQVLQEGDPGLAKKRAMLGLDSGDRPVLSQLLREAKTKAEQEDRLKEEKREAKEVHYENLFDDFEGLVHLEALEMLSRQITMRIEEKMRSLDPQKKQDAKETLQQVAELCETPEDDDDDDRSSEEGEPFLQAFQDKLETATQDIGIKMQFQPLITQYADILEWLSADISQLTDKAVYKSAISALAQTTALAVEVYHKSAELLLVKTRRSTADESDALNQLTVVLTKHVSDLATLYTDKLNNLSSADKESVNTYITNIFLEAGNSSTYIQNAFQLTIPILQIGAV